jgi:rhodanese-related sulfurtransferase
MFQLVERDLADASVDGLSTDRRYLIAYEAALNLATIALYCAGYETHGKGHHWATFEALPAIMGKQLRDVGAYFDSCRTKRNVGTYDRGGQLSEAEAAELLTEAGMFKVQLEKWLSTNYPALLG